MRAVSRDWQTYSTEVGSAFIRMPTPEALELTRLTLLNMDPPKHTRCRALIAKGFTPKMIRMLTAKIHDRAAQLVEAWPNAAVRWSSWGRWPRSCRFRSSAT